MTKKIKLFSNLRADFPSGLVVFLVALPLCLGIALASGAPPLSGIISGIVGGIVIGSLSNSHISVSGPAAGLTAIVLTAISTLGSFELFLLTVFLAGLFQLVLGFVRAGSISNYFPSNVIEGMLAGIGVIIILKEIPYAIGFEGGDVFSAIFNGIKINVQLGAVIITAVSLLILILWDKISFLKNLKLVPGALVAVISGVVLNQIFVQSGSDLAMGGDQLVKLPVPESFLELKNLVVTPDFSGFKNPEVWITAVTITIVASIETLLCIEASDRMDRHKRYTDTDRELKAQGIGNMISSLLGGLPMTSVVVRSSANASAGAESKTSSIIHGMLLLVCVLAIPVVLNMIPLATLAAVLLVVGYKLANPSKLARFWNKGLYQFVPFIATLLAVVLTDLLKGVALGMIISIIFILRGNLKRAYNFRKQEYEEGDVIHIDLAQEVSFLNKAAIKSTLNDLPENSKVIIDASETVYIARDVIDLIEEFATIKAREENIDLTLLGFKTDYQLENAENNNVFVTHNDEETENRKEKQDVY
ncbi:MAG: hypothetical protein BM557_05280 [Flavobacterium sp. MedPE-SWcel]|uniref:SulP family inorganic anion transporter n=1 Tax=uncultured Flavobacterium sp. TaxID=165435 RepID=UPI0009240B1A|nr:SulP family inorganic anion transporter [uncultured Flavobacterium sp.]OIQ20087.1 MAG: hypothetical protein BM557_05280 [Flavobacterium sp. MedPE-SWcel]